MDETKEVYMDSEYEPNNNTDTESESDHENNIELLNINQAKSTSDESGDEEAGTVYIPPTTRLTKKEAEKRICGMTRSRICLPLILGVVIIILVIIITTKSGLTFEEKFDTTKVTIVDKNKLIVHSHYSDFIIYQPTANHVIAVYDFGDLVRINIAHVHTNEPYINVIHDKVKDMQQWILYDSTCHLFYNVSQNPAVPSIPVWSDLVLKLGVTDLFIDTKIRSNNPTPDDEYSYFKVVDSVKVHNLRDITKPSIMSPEDCEAIQRTFLKNTRNETDLPRFWETFEIPTNGLIDDVPPVNPNSNAFLTAVRAHLQEIGDDETDYVVFHAAAQEWLATMHLGGTVGYTRHSIIPNPNIGEDTIETVAASLVNGTAVFSSSFHNAVIPPEAKTNYQNCIDSLGPFFENREVPHCECISEFTDAIVQNITTKCNPCTGSVSEPECACHSESFLLVNLLKLIPCKTFTQNDDLLAENAYVPCTVESRRENDHTLHVIEQCKIQVHPNVMRFYDHAGMYRGMQNRGELSDPSPSFISDYFVII